MANMDTNLGLLRDRGMGNATREEIAHDASILFRDVRAWDWSSTGPSICLQSIILIRESLIDQYRWAALQELLHEKAHVKAGNGHGVAFHKEFATQILSAMESQEASRYP